MLGIAAQGLGQEGAVLVNLAILLISRLAAIRPAGVRDLVETKVNSLSLRQVSEEAPGNDLTGIASGIIQPLVLGGSTVVPLEGAGGMSVWCDIYVCVCRAGT